MNKDGTLGSPELNYENVKPKSHGGLDHVRAHQEYASETRYVHLQKSFTKDHITDSDDNSLTKIKKKLNLSH